LNHVGLKERRFGTAASCQLEVELALIFFLQTNDG
jgi:hypothetical protein